MDSLLNTSNMGFKLLLAIIWALIPALIWLFFWLKHDEKHPEPNRLIITTFIFGICSVIAAFLIQNIIFTYFLKFDISKITNILEYKLLWGVGIIILLAGIEEILKFAAAYHGGLKTKANNEAIDPTVYLITAALGFAAFETFLFLISDMNGVVILSRVFQTGNLRFIGSALTHTVSSALVGFFLGLSYYRKRHIKLLYLSIGLIAATALHSLFNFFIMKGGNFGAYGFMLIWLSVIALLAFLEIIKKIKKS